MNFFTPFFNYLSTLLFDLHFRYIFCAYAIFLFYIGLTWLMSWRSFAKHESKLPFQANE